jgi:hypothetical protein
MNGGKDRPIFTTSGTYPWSFVIQISRISQEQYDGATIGARTAYPSGAPELTVGFVALGLYFSE